MVRLVVHKEAVGDTVTILCLHLFYRRFQQIFQATTEAKFAQSLKSHAHFRFVKHHSRFLLHTQDLYFLVTFWRALGVIVAFQVNCVKCMGIKQCVKYLAKALKPQATPK